MKTTDFVKKLSSQNLGESFEKQFGSKLNLAKYNREQLEDYRNKLRTMIFQQENTAGFNDLLTNEAYQKNKAMMELLNTRIKEMLGENIKALKDKMIELSEAKKGVRAPLKKIHAKGSKPDFLDMDKDGDKKEPMKKAVADKKAGPQKGVNPFAKKDSKVKEGAKPDFLDLDKDGDKKEPMKKAVKDKAVKEVKMSDLPSTKVQGKSYGNQKDYQRPPEDARRPANTMKLKDKKGTPVKEGSKHPKDCDCNECSGMWESTGDYSAKKGADKKKNPFGNKKKVKESSFKHNVRFVNESIEFLLREDEEGKAKAITAAGDIVNDYTSWMQRVGQYQTKTMIELADAIKADFGAAEAEQFKNAVGPALSATLEVLTQQREAVSGAVAVLAGEAAPEAPMGAEPDMGGELDAGMDVAGPDAMNPDAGADLGDEFSAADAASGAGTPGREMRESREQRRVRKIAESHSILAKLAK